MNAKPKYHGVVVPMVTPVTAEGAIDEPAVGRIVEHLIAGGVAGIFVIGTTGESASIHAELRPSLVESAVKAARQRTLVYAGISGNCLRESIESARLFKQLGADVLVAHPPFFYAISDADMEKYFRQLADASPLPLLLYNIPQATEIPIPLPVVKALGNHPNIAGIKDSANDPGRLTELLAWVQTKPGYAMLAGNGLWFTHALKLGAHGIVPSAANLHPKEHASMCRLAEEKRWDEVEKLQKQTEALTAEYQRGRMLGESLAMLKLLMSRKGLCSPHMLPPLSAAQVPG